MCQQRKRLASFDQLVGASEQRRWNFQPECLPSFEINMNFVSGGLLYGEVGRLCSMHDLVYVRSCLAERPVEIGTEAYKAADSDVSPNAWQDGR